MATDTKQTVKPVSIGQTVETVMNALSPEERAVVRWNISSPERVRHLAEDAIVVPRTIDEGPDLLVADVAPSVVLVFQETPTHFELIDLMGKRALNWDQFPPPADGASFSGLNGHASPPREAATKAANGQASQ